MADYKEYGTDREKALKYNRRVTIGLAEQDRWKKDAEAAFRRYENKPMGQKSGSGHNIVSPEGTSIIDALYSALTAVDVSFLAEAIGAGTASQEQLASAALDREFEQSDAQDRANDAVKDALLAGIGWAKVGYEYFAEEQELPRPQAAVAADVQKLIEAAEAEGRALEVDIIQNLVPLTEVREVNLSQRIVVDHIPWDEIIWDPEAKTWRNVKWLCQIEKAEPEDVKQNPLYVDYCKRNRQSKRLQELASDETLSVSGVLQTVQPAEEDERITIYHMYDLETGTLCIFAKGEDFLLAEVPIPFAMNEDLEDRSPIVPCVLRRSTGRVRGISDMDVMAPTLEELDLYRSKLTTYLERFAPKVLAKKGAFTQAGRKAMRSREIGQVVELDDGYEPASDVQEMRVPVLPEKVFDRLNELREELYEATGANELVRGLFPDRRRTATETTQVVSASAMRAAEKRLGVTRFLQGIGWRILQLMQMFYTEDQMLRYQDTEGPIEWTWSAEDITFATKLRIDLTPKEHLDRQTRSDRAIAALNILGTLAAPGPNGEAGPLDQVELYKWVAQEMGVPAKQVALFFKSDAEKQKETMASQQAAAGMAAASGAGVPRPDMVAGPMDAEQLAAATNQGAIPPEMVAAAGGGSPFAPGAAEEVARSQGVEGPPVLP